MKEVIKKISLDLSRKTNTRVLFGNQVEYNSRVFLISIFDDGVPYFVEKSTSASINIRRPDGSSWSYIADVTDDGKVMFTSTVWVCEKVGDVTFTVSLYEGLQRITSSSFVMEVTEDLVDDIIYNDVAENATLFQQVMSDYADVMSDEQARLKAEEDRVFNESLRINAENSRFYREIERDEAEQERRKNEEARLKVTDDLIQAFQNLLTLQAIFIEKGETA